MFGRGFTRAGVAVTRGGAAGLRSGRGFNADLLPIIGVVGGPGPEAVVGVVVRGIGPLVSPSLGHVGESQGDCCLVGGEQGLLKFGSPIDTQTGTGHLEEKRETSHVTYCFPRHPLLFKMKGKDSTRFDSAIGYCGLGVLDRAPRL